ncbi:DoxX family protein [Zobellia alginiliquefaciens]|uniref:DoxX family protein n=1 Tax=Zobellia alginiliquefaciens TaxID=3032586 RepID=UPI0023E416EB|nr:hypothetical protein [Zobellia alginiliquefaciens]
MKPLLVLITVTVIALLIFKCIDGIYDIPRSARIGMTAMLLFTALGHFMFTKGMAMMIPDFIPLKKELVYLTAFIEITAAIGLHMANFRTMTAWLLIFFFVLMLPANIKACFYNLNYQTGNFDGPGLMYLWFRVPSQILFIVWVYFSSIRI